mgnify:CR=1 FL=1
MTLGLAILLVLFGALLLLSAPVAFAIGAATAAAMFALGYPSVPLSIASDLGNGVDSFALLAIPFFILAGELMRAGGLARRLIDFAASMLGGVRGGLSMVNATACMLFGTISGSAVAAVSSIGGTLIPEMNRKGYDRDFNIAITTSAATTGLLIPPSNIMIVYALVASNVSVAALFLAGILPGALVGLGILLVGYGLSRARGYGGSVEVRAGAGDPIGRAAWRALPSLLLVVIILGGILGGIFTATEASAVAVLWALLLALFFYREIGWRDLPAILSRAARTTGVVLFLVATSYSMSRLLTLEQVPQRVSQALLEISASPVMVMLLINCLLLAVGTFMDMTPAVLILTPIFLPAAMALGIDPIHFGIIMIANLSIGLLTPPVGTCLFVGAMVGHSSIAAVSRAMIPFYAVMIVSLLIITYVPALSLFLPGLVAK